MPKRPVEKNKEALDHLALEAKAKGRGSFTLPVSEHLDFLKFMTKVCGPGEFGISEFVRVGIYLLEESPKPREVLEKALTELGRRSPGRPSKNGLSQNANAGKAAHLPAFTGLTDDQWSKLQSVVEADIQFRQRKKTKKAGRRSTDVRQALNGIFSVFAQGSRFQDVSPEFASSSTTNRFYNRLVDAGLWQNVCKTFYSTLSAAEKDQWKPLLAETLLDPNKFRRKRQPKKNS